MSESFDQLQELKRITLSDDARVRIRSRLELFVSLKPREEAGVIVYPAYEEPAVAFAWSAFLRSWRTRALLAAMMLVITGSATIRAAEGALPGDLLYTVKLHVNEEAQALFARSDESRASVEVSRLARRLQEVEQLAAAGRLTQEQETKLIVRIEEHSTAARKHITNAAETTTASVQVVRIQNELISTIAAHDGVLNDLISKPKQQKHEPLAQVRSVLEGEIAAAATTGLEVAAVVPVPVVPHIKELAARLATIGDRLAELGGLFLERELPGENSRIQVDQLFLDAEASHERGIIALERDNIIPATLALLDSERALVELETFFAASVPAATSSLEEIEELSQDVELMPEEDVAVLPAAASGIGAAKKSE